MGSNRLSEIQMWRDPSDELEVRDRAVLIGPEPPTTHPTFTRIYQDDRGIARYGEELGGISVWKAFPIRLQLRNTGLGSDAVVTLSTIALEDRKRTFAKMTAVLAYTPASFDWFGVARFKTVNRIGARERNEIIQKAFQKIPREGLKGGLRNVSVERLLWKEISSLPQDIFGNEDCCYCRLFGYEQSDVWHQTLEDEEYSLGDIPSQYEYSNPNRRRNPVLLYGVCDNFDACRQAVEGSMCLTSAFEMVKRDDTPRVKDYWGDWIPTTADTGVLAEHFRHTAAIKALAGCTPEEQADLVKTDPLRKMVERDGEVAVHAMRLFFSMLRSHHRRTIKRSPAIVQTDYKE